VAAHAALILFLPGA